MADNEWFYTLYDDFRQRTGFGSIPHERTAKDADFIMSELRLKEGARILDLCCGTGRHAIELSVRGFDVVGVEQNRRYLTIAQTRAGDRGASPEFIEGDVREVELPVDVDAAILMWNSFGYFSDEENRDLLRRVGTALRPNSRFLLELLNRDWIIRHYEETTERDVAGIRIVEERELDLWWSRIRSTISRHEDQGVVRRTTDWRLYSVHELRTIGEEVGLQLIEAYGNLERKPVSLDTRLMRLVFEKPGE